MGVLGGVSVLLAPFCLLLAVLKSAQSGMLLFHFLLDAFGSLLG
jgi:hypothetical protein